MHQQPQQLNTFTQQRHSFQTTHHDLEGNGLNGSSSSSPSVSIPMPFSTTSGYNASGTSSTTRKASSAGTGMKRGFLVRMKRIARLCGCSSSSASSLSSKDKLSMDEFLNQEDKSAKGKTSTRINRCCMGVGMTLIVFLMMCYWFVYVWNAPYYRLEASGPLIHEKDAAMVADKRYLIKTRTYPSFWIVALSPQKDVWISRQLYERGWWESAIEDTFEKILKEFFKKNALAKESNKKTCRVVDVGGNLGFFSLLSAAWGCQVKTYEVQPDMIKKIQASSVINGFEHLMTIRHRAVDSESGKFVGFALGSSDNLGSAFVYNPDENDKTVKIETVTLNDELMTDIKDPNNNRITLLKVDVEGNEMKVFQGAGKVLKYVDNVLVEVSRSSLLAVKLLIEHGFNVITVLEEPRLVWGYFVKTAPSKTFINPTYEQVAAYVTSLVGKRDVWFSRKDTEAITL
ncbi:hypothetical protein C9374_007499 [Naegleria lovaniensis]|uniref:Methyltransferase FkbM domain-containing protein n=1 Tax=Naegleria lovaniensis TaxID=51637 RepID=A0AA88KHA2_NAELO|nr:uncharacterized protein C9374_007499 [Naegleria lovaniensis]KAG2379360.1 hypothetical protein C9374_007499 [Naegleria lovaniensis]